MSLPPALSLWMGRTVHARFQPFAQRFSYRLMMIDIDIDRLGEAAQQTWAFTVGKPGLFSFRSEDHGPKQKDAPLRPWAEAQLAKAGVDLSGGMIRLVSFPRHLFYKFAPLSLWYGYGPSGDLRGVIYEVNNTFGETHCYVARASDGRNQHDTDKVFHVSPFFDVTGTYRFTLRSPGDVMDVTIDSLKDGARLHMANIKAKRAPASGPMLAKIAITRPFSTLGVTLGIHWEALKLWRRGAGYRSRPALPKTPTTVALPVENAAKLPSPQDAA